MKKNKTKRVTFRVTEEEYKRLEELAYGSYRLISVYCRDCVFGKKITVIPGVDEAAKQLRHIGNNLNQLTWRVNEGTLTAVNLEETKKELPVYGTGGLGETILSHCKYNITLDKDLVLKGLNILYKKNK